MTTLSEVSLWENTWSRLVGFAEHNAHAAGMPAWLLLSLWGILGAILLVSSWQHRRHTVRALSWWAWLAATCWVVWGATPNGNPVPAALLAALGLVASAEAVTIVPIAGLVCLGVLA